MSYTNAIDNTVQNKNTETKNEKLSKKIIKQEQYSYARLREEALNALADFKRCQNNFDFISEDKLVDVSIYDIQKALSRYEYLICELKRIK